MGAVPSSSPCAVAIASPSTLPISVAPRPAEHLSWERTRVLAVLEGDLTGADGEVEAARSLQEPGPPGRQIVGDVGAARVQVVEVDDVEVGPVPGRDHTAVTEPDVEGV